MDIVDVLQDIVSTGQPPTEGCAQLGVGYEDAFRRIEQFYLRDFKRSTEKFIIGPYGSGKTHFLRQLLELAREHGCATAEVVLSRDVDITKPLVVYKEIAREIRLPGQPLKGIAGLLRACFSNMRAESPSPEMADEYVRCRIDGLRDVSFEDEVYRRVLIETLSARVTGDEDQFENGCRWLSGEVALGALAKSLNASTVPSGEQGSFGRRALLSLGQFVKAMGYPGTVLGIDEAEQAASVPKSHLQRILSMLRSEIDAVVRVQGASLFIAYAVLPDVIQHMQDYPALSQRIAEPDPARKFFDGNTFSPRIDLGQPYANSSHSALAVLEQIGERLVNLLYEQYGNQITMPKEQVLANCCEWAEDVSLKNASISNRRDMVRLTASRLLHLYQAGTLDNPSELPVIPTTGDAEV